MRLLFLGDIVGRPGRNAVAERLPALRERWRLDCVVVNGENAAGGFGITEAICDEILMAGADAVTLGNHSWDQREALVFIERQPRLVRPANFPPGTPGRGAAMVETRNGARVLVVNLMGRLYMDALDDPFAVADRTLAETPLREVADAILVDIHAEATSEKQALAYHLDGRVTVVVGTHTHVPTADHRILPGGTAYMSDAGMCGDYEFGARHGPRRAAAPLPAEDARRPPRGGVRRGHAQRPRDRDRRRAPASACASRRCGSGRRSRRPGRGSGIEPPSHRAALRGRRG